MNVGKRNRFSLRAAFAAVATAGLMLGCSNYHQNPYANQSDEVQNPEKAGNSKPVPHPAPKPEAFRFDVDNTLTFREDMDGVAGITARMVIQHNGHDPKIGEDYTVEIENLSDFPGATYDPDEGKFKWHPAPGTVESGNRRVYRMNLRVYTLTNPAGSNEKRIDVVVTRPDRQPEIVSVNGLTTPVREGTKKRFEVIVRDPDATEVAGQQPQLVPVAVNRGKNAAQMVAMNDARYEANPKRDTSDTTLWHFDMVLDSSGQSVTPANTTLSFGLVAFSQFGKASPIVTTNVSFLTKVVQPLSTWKDVYEVQAKQPIALNFNVYDPQNKGHVSVSWRSCAGAVCKCTSTTYQSSMLNCSVTWTAPDTARTTDYNVEYTATNSSPNPGDRDSEYQSFIGRIRVQPAPQPAPPDPAANLKSSSQAMEER